jgi:cell division protein ZapA
MMPEITVDIAGRAYRLGCGEGEEKNVQRLADAIDREARALMRVNGAMPEGRLLLMTALIIADRLNDTEALLADAEQRAAQAQKQVDSRVQGDMFGEEFEEALAQRLIQLAERIEEAASAR